MLGLTGMIGLPSGLTTTTFGVPSIVGMSGMGNGWEFEFSNMDPMLVSELLGNVEVGIDDIDSVTDLLTAAECGQPLDEACTICHELLNSAEHGGPGAPVRRIKRCNHTYCAPCIERWLSNHKKCPVCNIDVDAM